MGIVADLGGKVALITGGGQGIGAAIAEAYADAGASVAVTGRRSEPLGRVANRILEDGGQSVAITADVRDLDAMTDAVQATQDHFGRLDIVVANAAIHPAPGPVLDSTTESWRDVLDVNLTGVWNTARAAVPVLKTGGGGSIIIVGSGRARVQGGGSGAYAVSKAGVSALTRVLAAELRDFNIAVNELIPGPTRTPGMGIDGSDYDREIEQRWAEQREWLKDPNDVAQLAVFVAGLPRHGPTGQVFSLVGRLL